MLIFFNLFSTLSTFTFLVLSCRAQQVGLFEWSFGPHDDLTNTVPSCTSVSIAVLPVDATAGPTPPFYMISYALNSTPVTSFIGSDPNNLTWTITQPVGSQLAMSVVDANGSPGGLAADMISVLPGATTECVINPPPAQPFTISANVSGFAHLDTCEPWGLTMQGGVPPYTVTLVQPDSPNFTNVTLSADQNTFTYINRADPNSNQLIAAASDSTGRWASGTPIVTTGGSTDFSCGGAVNSAGPPSSSGPATPISTAPALASSLTSNSNGSPTITLDSRPSVAKSGDESSSSHRPVIMAVSIALVVLALLVALSYAALYIWKRKRQAGLPRFLRRITIEPKSASPLKNGFTYPSLEQAKPAYSRLVHSSNPSLSSLPTEAPIIALSYHPKEGNSWTTKPLATHFNGAIHSNSSSVDLQSNSSGSPATIADAKTPAGSNDEKIQSSTAGSRLPLTVVNLDAHSDFVYQHQDAGPVRLEVPPPYLHYNSQPEHSFQLTPS